MKKDQVQIGGTYVAKVSGQLAQVRIDAESRFGGWDATNVSTQRKVRIKSAQRLRRETAASTNTEAPAASDLPPQDIDERIAAAPPSIVPYEQRRARAEAAQVETADDAPQYDPTRCATKRCRGTPVMTYLERPMCQACWDRHCEEEQPSEVSETAGDACRPTEEQEPLEQENAMSKKKTNKKQSKAQPAAAKAKREKKAATPKVKATGEQKPKRVSALDAAATVLKKAGKPMHAQELIAAMAEQDLWKSPGGKTPHATLYAAILREIGGKGKDARFRKVDRGQFQFAGKGK
ncbi:MAG: hypothetical protein HUU26_00505 [Gemmatimonadaceae bacterium]|nr:winged helix-turn-helix domain-containing protein [Phycisphaerae bacterium]NUQ10798.1 hypothetical protein [Gemmatimonadaceae bacterium]